MNNEIITPAALNWLQEAARESIERYEAEIDMMERFIEMGPIGDIQPEEMQDLIENGLYLLINQKDQSVAELKKFLNGE